MKKIILLPIQVFKELKLSVKLLLIAFVFVVFGFGMIEFTGTPTFCNSCHIMKPYYDSWKVSGHDGVSCLKCHLKPGLLNYADGKIKGLSQSIDCIVGRVGTKPSATVYDVSCLRSECHSTKELLSKNIDFDGIKFTHSGHIENVVGGIKMSCGTCHASFEGEEHFKISTEVCFTCHFLKSHEGEGERVKVGCTGCHRVPDKVIERGLVKVNHAEFVSYQASCEDSCHKKQIEIESNVSENICLNCHNFKKEPDMDYEELHEAHSTHEKVECFACHGKLEHGFEAPGSVASMMDCEGCHSDTHNIQRSIYTAGHEMVDKENHRILGPMFLTHVECSGCHIEQGQAKFKTVDTFDKVAKAVPKACDNCHEPGTGQRYIPFWQKNIKNLYGQVEQLVTAFEKRSELDGDADLQMKAGQARSILNSILSDGSWGVHNFKYTEAMLLKARDIVSE